MIQYDAAYNEIWDTLNKDATATSVSLRGEDKLIPQAIRTLRKKYLALGLMRDDVNYELKKCFCYGRC